MPKTVPALRGAAPRADGSPEGVNLSQLLDWQRCRYRWHLRHRRQIDRRSMHRPMDLGSAVHAGIAGGIRQYTAMACPTKLDKTATRKIFAASVESIDVFAKVWQDERGTPHDDKAEEWAATMELARQLTGRTLAELDLTRWDTVLLLRKVPLVEQKLSIPFLPGIPFYGTADVVWGDRADKHKSIWVADWKVRESLQPVEHEEIDLQLPVYQYLLERHGVPTVGAIKFQIRNILPKQPTLNQNGAMSRSRIATTWDVYRDALIAAELDPADYEEEMRPKLDVPFFRMDRLYRNQFYVNRIWDKIVVPLGKAWAKKNLPIRSMHYLNCGGCWARNFCLAELRGEDMTFLLQTEYVDQNDPRAKMILSPEDFDFEE